ncbi:MAG: glycosyltransferase family 8 protein [Xanthobacteraceae bacterium]
MTGGPIHVAYAADANYGPYAGISISSVLRRFPLDWGDLHFHLVSNGIAVRDIHRIDAMAKANLASLSVHHWHGLNNREFPWRHSKYVTPSTYAKLLLARILPSAIERVIYLDCDTIILTDISELWRLTKETSVLAACPDRHINSTMSDHKREIGMPPSVPYFNAGVLVMNLAAWREGKIITNISEAAKQIPECRFYDQDPLNRALADQMTELPAKWNVQVNDAAMISDVGIVHFSGKQKPWQLGYDGAGADLFRAAKRASPWRYMLPETGLGRVIRRLQKSASKKLRV